MKTLMENKMEEVFGIIVVVGFIAYTKRVAIEAKFKEFMEKNQ